MWRRVAQSGFETWSLKEFLVSPRGGLSITPNSGVSYSEESARTGLLGLEAEQSQYHLWFEDSTRIRTSYFLKKTSLNADYSMLEARGLNNGESVRVGVRLSSDAAGYLELSRSDLGLLSTASPYLLSSFLSDQWIAVGVDTRAGPNGWFSFYMDGLLIMRAEGDFWDEISSVHLGALGLQGQVIAYADDWYVDATDDAEDEKPPPSPRLEPLYAVGDGTHRDWQVIGDYFPFQAVTKKYIPDEETNPILYADAAELKQTFFCTTPNIGLDERITNLYSLCMAQSDGLGQKGVKHIVIVDGVEYDGNDEVAPTGADYIKHSFDTSDGTNAWENTDISNIEFGFESLGTF